MKHIHLKFLILLFSFTFILSCSSDDDSDGSTDNPKSENLKPLGTSASNLLSQNTYTSMRVELAFSSGYRPQQQSIDDFKTFLLERVNKPDGITFIETEIVTPFTSSQTLDDIKDIENEQRTQYTVGDEIAVFVYFTHAHADTDTEISFTLGTAYLNTSIVVYEQTLREISISQNADLYILEETTLQHEFGHLFGLVNIQNDDIHAEHEDLAHRKHCFVEDCLMYYESNTRRFFRNRVSVPLLDPLCIEDLQAKGGK